MTVTVCPNCDTCWDAASTELADAPAWASPTARWCPACRLARERRVLLQRETVKWWEHDAGPG